MKPKVLLATALATTLAFTAAHAATQDKAGNRLEALHAAHPVKDEPQRQGCTADGAWCAEATTSDDGNKNGGDLHVYSKTDPALDLNIHLDSPAAPKTSEAHTVEYFLWPYVIRPGDARGDAFLGVLYQTTTMYSSGGGAGTIALKLFRVSSAPKGHPDPVLTLPYQSAIDIRACLSEADTKRRAGACTDSFWFNTALTLDPAVTTGAPRLVYTTKATSWPGHVARNEKNSLQAPPLHQSDLVTVTNKRCSFSRTFTLDGKSGTYELDQPLPDCSDYTEP